MQHGRIGRVGLAVLGVVGLTLASCSSNGSDSAAPKKTTTTSPAAERPGATTTTGGAGDGGGGDADGGDTGSEGDGGAPTTGKPLERYADYETKDYDDPSHWVCRPDTEDDLCHGDLDSTSIDGDGTLTVEKFDRAKDPGIDCFYVYPTISRDQSNYSDWDASPTEEGYVTVNQAARLAQVCRVFAPVYRQGTLAGLTSRLGGGQSKFTDTGDPFADVLDAFRTYMAEDNDGRGFVLIGHSQGSGMLNQLIKTEIDPNEDVRSHLVGAYLAGGAVAVPDGKVVGGDFQHVPLCTKDGEDGCVITWATFRSTATPPSNSFFGRVRGGKPGQVAGCVSPADPSGKGGDVEAHSFFPANRKASILSSAGADAPGGSPWVEASAGKVTTPYVSLPGLVTVRCAEKDGFHFLQATVHGDPSDPRADDIPGDLTPEWGLHLVMGDIVNQVSAQADTYGS